MCTSSYAYFVLKGEAQQAVLEARLGRCVDGLDVALYKNALAVRRRFLEERTQNTTWYLYEQSIL